MARWARDLVKSINTYEFKILLMVLTIIYLSAFALFRMIVGSSDSVVMYAILYSYCIISTVMLMIYNIFPNYYDKEIVTHRKPNGDVECPCLFFSVIFSFWLGPFSIVVYNFRNIHNPWHLTFLCRSIIYIPALASYVLLIIMPLIYDDNDKVDFIIPYAITWLLWIYIFAESILVVLKWNRNIWLFHPFSWFIIPFYSIVLCYKQSSTEDSEEDIKYLVTSGVLNVKLECYEKDKSNEDLELIGTPDFRNSNHENFYQMFNRVARTEVFGPKRMLTSNIVAKENPDEMYNRQTHGYSMRMPNVFVHRKTNDFRKTLHNLDQLNE